MKIDTLFTQPDYRLRSPRTTETEQSSFSALFGQMNETSSLNAAYEALGSNKENMINNALSGAPDSVREAWERAEEKTGVNGLGVDGEGRMTHISEMTVSILQENARRQGRGLSPLQGNFNLLGSSVESAIAAAKNYLNMLNMPGKVGDSYKNDEQRFYQSFLQELYQIQ